jgi:nucleoside 2-deoxyribosyltransferase
MPDAKNNRPHLYLAAPLFSDAERAFNGMLCEKLERLADVFLPERDGLLYRDLVAAGMAAEKARRMIFDIDVAAIRQCDLILAVLDGRALDEGVAFELGVGYSHSKFCIGLRTDGRTLLPSGDNPMIVAACNVLVTSTHEAIAAVSRYTPARIAAI